MREATELDRIIGTNIRRFRRLCGMGQQALAEKLGVSYQQLQKHERAMNRVPASRLYRLHEILEIPLTAFFEPIRIAAQAERRRTK